MDEDLELKLIKQIEQHERERDERIEKLIEENSKSFEDFYCETFYNKLKRIKYGTQTLEDYFNEDSSWELVPVDLILTDNIQNSSAKLKTIINTNYDNAFTELSEKSDKVTIKKHYVHALSIKYKGSVLIVTTNPKYISRQRGFKPGSDQKTIRIENETCLNLSNYKVINEINLKATKPYISSAVSGVVKTTKKCSYLYKHLLKNITQFVKSRTVARGGYFLSNIILNSVDIKHVLCPIYKIRFHKPGFDAEFVVNAQTKQCDKI